MFNSKKPSDEFQIQNQKNEQLIETFKQLLAQSSQNQIVRDYSAKPPQEITLDKALTEIETQNILQEYQEELQKTKWALIELNQNLQKYDAIELQINAQKESDNSYKGYSSYVNRANKIIESI